MEKPLNIPAAMSEIEYLKHIKEISLKNKVFKNYIGQGYYDTITLPLSCAIFLKIRAGTHSTHLIRPKFLKADWKVYSTFKPW
jgi:hypothetical protein